MNSLCKLVVFVYPTLSGLFLSLTHGWRSDQALSRSLFENYIRDPAVTRRH